ncbi:CDP-alcohol phosphatidyltransferase [Verminephrobacter eiseniae EF01-2]|uniref:CDP-alcohol phosphatidyltransferase n=1 Tax=Verminephrobacter eiseniae (strain EF01-2) TaxID=391735 RepID=A1WMI6_VEREI|nr:CDP-alcohol phosphatidyltransferase family protein [Verminephrobacter eiseniae]ABM58843.1 CDP-alcohol phosphatidyltransferase [Verminephrobacter eiseniae EF01-2]
MSDSRTSSLLRQALVPPNAVTLTSLAIALVAMWKLPSAVWPTWSVIGCIVLDVMDGRIARMSNRPNALGAQLDSLVDVVAFGALPALLVLHHAASTAWMLHVPTAILFIACAALRLARFNAKTTQAPQRFFTGLPTPVAAGLVASVILVLQRSDQAGHASGPLSGGVICLIAGLAAWLMVTKLPFPSFKTNGGGAASTTPKRRTLIAIVALMFIGLFFHPSLTLLLTFAVYAASGWVIRRKMNQFMDRLAYAKAAASGTGRIGCPAATEHLDRP